MTKSNLFVTAGLLCFAPVAVFSQTAQAEGIKVGNLTILPYVNLEATYDSNVDLDRHEYKDWYFTVNPGVDFTYTGNDWGLRGTGWYAYDKYRKYTELNEPRFGFHATEYWETPKGLRVVLGQRWMKSYSNDSILSGGRGVWRERSYLELNGAVSQQLSESTGLTLSGQYAKNSYKNDSDKYGQLYGWNEVSTGLELAHRLTHKSNLLLGYDFQRYSSKGAQNIDNESLGHSVLAGAGSRATERVTYRMMTGVSFFNYARGERNDPYAYVGGPRYKEDDDWIMGWVYRVDGSWLISQKWAASLAGSSYYQPSETQQNQAIKVYTISAGLTYRPAKRVTITGDLGYRREEDEFKRSAYTQDGIVNYRYKINEDVYSVRLRANYQFVKHAAVYTGIEYEDWESKEGFRDYDRFRATMGLRLRY